MEGKSTNSRIPLDAAMTHLLKGDYSAAADTLEDFLQRMPDSQQGWAMLAYCLENKKDWAGAANCYHRLLELSDADADAHFNLARMYQLSSELEKSEQHYRRALALKPDAQAKLALANVLVRLHRPGEAKHILEKGLQCDPENLDVRQSLATLCADLGDFDEAEAWHRRILADRPDVLTSYLALIELDKLDPKEPLASNIANLHAKREKLGMDDRILLEFLCGRLYERRGEFAKAFQHFQAGNKLKRQNIQYSSNDRLQRFQSYERYFTSELLERLRVSGHHSDLPVFIVGMPRSGTTLVEQILASHSKIHGAGELTILPELAESIVSNPRTDRFPGCLDDLPDEVLGRLGRIYVDKVRRFSPNAERITDKLPSNYTLLGFIEMILPQASIIYCRRHPVATCLSCYKHLFSQGNEFSYSIDELADRYYEHHLYMNHWRKVLPENRFLEVRYEDLVSDYEAVAKKLVAHCGLEWDPACLQFHRTRRAVNTLSSSQVRRPIYESAVDQWRKYERQLAPLIEALEKRGIEMN